MTLAIKCIHNLPPHLSYVSTLPDITQKRKTYVVFLSKPASKAKMCNGHRHVPLIPVV